MGIIMKKKILSFTILTIILSTLFTIPVFALDKERINRQMVLFDAIEGNKIGIVSPQTVTVLLRNCDRWIKISSWLGSVWVDLEYIPSTQALEDELKQIQNRSGKKLAVYAECLVTGFTLKYNEHMQFFSASITKAPLALWIYQLVEEGYACLDDTITYTREDFMGGSGIIRHNYAIGQEISVRRLLGLNLYESDNIATLMLIRHFGLNGYKEFIESIGGNRGFVNNKVMDSRITASEAMLFMREIHNFTESDNVNASLFKEQLLNNQFPFFTSDYYEVASKTGWTSNLAWHMIATVYSQNPFNIVILTDREGWTGRDYNDFQRIYEMFAEFSAKWGCYN
jgi:beta-lactamase class A